MKYFKNTELAKIHHVSEKTVRNWISGAQSGKNKLKLHQHNEHVYIANSSKNNTLIEQLVAKGKKYKNTIGYKVVEPKAEFYQLYSQKQILDIISNLDIYREIPLQYSYFNSGAKRWDDYVRRLLKEEIPNSLSNTVELLTLNTDYIDSLLKEHKSVNIIDLGPGNAMPIKNLLAHFIDSGQLKRYIALDMSQEMLDIAEQNIQEWFGNKVNFEGHVRDIVYDRFDDLLVSETVGVDAGSTINIILLLGGTLTNFRNPNHALSTIHASMGKQDLFFYTKKLDTQNARRFFELAAPGNQAIELVLDLIGIDPSYYTIEQDFDMSVRTRYVQAKLNVALTANFLVNGQKRSIEFNKDERILLWRARHQNAIDIVQQFDVNGFELVLATTSKDGDYILTASNIKTGLEV